MSVAAGMDTKEMESFAKVTINNLGISIAWFTVQSTCSLENQHCFKGFCINEA